MSVESSKLIAINNPILPIDQPKICPKEKLVVWCGRNEYGHKRLDRMLQIWRKLWHRHPDWQLVVLGGGNSQRFKELCELHNIHNVTFAGFQQPEDYYARASILCMTSASEGWGMVLVEAQSYGCVPVAYESFASLRDIIIDGENGMIIPPFNEYKYIEELEKLINGIDLRKQMSENARKSVSRFCASDIADLWLSKFEKLLICTA